MEIEQYLYQNGTTYAEHERTTKPLFGRNFSRPNSTTIYLKIFLDYANEIFRKNKPTICIRANEGIIYWILPLQQMVFRTCRYTYNISRKKEKKILTLEHSAPAWLDYIIVVTRKSEQDHNKK